MNQEQTPHRLMLNERSQLTITGVAEVASFEEAAVVLHTAMGTLVVQGQELKLKALSQEDGQVCIDGTVSALIYEEPRPGSGWRRLFG